MPWLLLKRCRLAAFLSVNTVLGVCTDRRWTERGEARPFGGPARLSPARLLQPLGGSDTSGLAGLKGLLAFQEAFCLFVLRGKEFAWAAVASERLWAEELEAGASSLQDGKLLLENNTSFDCFLCFIPQ